MIAQPVRRLHDVGVGVVHDQPVELYGHRAQAWGQTGCRRPGTVGGHDGRVTEIRIHAPGCRAGVGGRRRRRPSAHPDRVGVAGDVPDGTRYGIRAAGDPERRFDPSRVLVDPQATEVWFGDEHERDDRPGQRAASAVVWGDRAGVGGGDAVARAAAPALDDPPARRVRGARARADDASRAARPAARSSPRSTNSTGSRRLGVSVLELLPVHHSTPTRSNYWGYMALVFGAIHRQYGSSEVAAAERAGRTGDRGARPGHRGVARRRVQPHDRGGRARADCTTCAASPTATTTCVHDGSVVRRRCRHRQHHRCHRRRRRRR